MSVEEGGVWHPLGGSAEFDAGKVRSLEVAGRHLLPRAFLRALPTWGRRLRIDRSLQGMQLPELEELASEQRVAT